MGLVRIDRHNLYSSSNQSVIKEIGERIDAIPPFAERLALGHHVDEGCMRFIQLTRSLLFVLASDRRGRGIPRLDSRTGRWLLERIRYKKKKTTLVMSFEGWIVALVNLETGVIETKKSERFDSAREKVLGRTSWESFDGLIEDVRDINVERTSNCSTPLWERAVNEAIPIVYRRMLYLADCLYISLLSTGDTNHLERIFKSPRDNRIGALDIAGEEYKLRAKTSQPPSDALTSKLASLKADHLRLKLLQWPKHKECRAILQNIIDDYVAVKRATDKEFAELLEYGSRNAKRFATFEKRKTTPKVVTKKGKRVLYL